ncbi:Formate--tetrahydrofolate ligase [Hyphomicrobium sp. 1Nfss2.1]|uniref:formate--tetrahydrofolate ligase n=1 Tax=Hyphomicrobium sp. 1Nfss2.1 TaxID=3413936 RepID=UPI003C7A8937
MPVRSHPETSNQPKRLPIVEVATKIGVSPRGLLNFGPHKAKVTADLINALENKPDGTLLLVTSVGPTLASGSGAAAAIAISDALNRIGARSMSCLREASLAECLAEACDRPALSVIDWHFTGDLHAVTAAHNYLAALIDNHIHWGNELDIDARRIVWRRVLDLDDRALRSIVNSLGGVENGFPREDGFGLTASSEVMAILCLSLDHKDLLRRLGNIVVAYNSAEAPLYARDLRAQETLAALLAEALLPNLVQTPENNPAFIHGGPCGTSGHGCTSLIATKTALKLADYVITDAGCGADVDVVKFFDIKCRTGGLTPAAVVIITSPRALKLQSGIGEEDVTAENVSAVANGCAALKQHIANIRKFGVGAIVAIATSPTDTQEEVDAITAAASIDCTPAISFTHWEQGRAGVDALARHLMDCCDASSDGLRRLYSDGLPLWYKARTIATEFYGATDISADEAVVAQFKALQAAGYGHLPISMVMTPGAAAKQRRLRAAEPLVVREVVLAAGAEFITVVCGENACNPGLPKPQPKAASA